MDTTNWRDERTFARIPVSSKQTKYFLCGLSSDGQARLGIDTERHLITIAGTRAGKGIGVILPNAALYAGSLFALDCKGQGELAAQVARHRATVIGQPVYCIDPWEIALPHSPHLRRARFNPLAGLADAADPMAEAFAIAETIVNAPHQEAGTEAHFSRGAVGLIAALILHTVDTRPPAEQHLGTVYSLLKDPTIVSGMEEEIPEGTPLIERPLLAQIIERPEWHVATPLSKLAADAAMDAYRSAYKDRNGVISTATKKMQIYGSPALIAALSSSDKPEENINFDDLKIKRITIFVCIAGQYLDSHFGFLRLLLTFALRSIERVPGKPSLPVYFLIDEAHGLGYMPLLDKGAGRLAGLGARLHMVFQNISQLQQLYKTNWQTFTENSTQQIFGVGHQTAEYVSQLLGKHEVNKLAVSQNKSFGQSDGRESSTSVNFSETNSFSKSMENILDPQNVRINRGVFIIEPGYMPALVGKIDIRDHRHGFYKILDKSPSEIVSDISEPTYKEITETWPAAPPVPSPPPLPPFLPEGFPRKSDSDMGGCLIVGIFSMAMIFGILWITAKVFHAMATYCSGPSCPR